MLGSLAIVLYYSLYGIIFGWVLDIVAFPLLLLTLHFGSEGLRCRYWGVALVGLLLALTPALLTVLMFTSRGFALGLRKVLVSL
ncbi:hypothetical protein ACLESO_18400 [Pyxidicoccus sp. 3LG]